MSSNLDKSLDEITGGRRGGRQGRSRRGGKSAVQVAGGVTKRTAVKASKPATQTAPTGPQPRGESKIIVSNLPDDVNEQQIKEYFAGTVGPVKRVFCNYNKNGRSTGVATIVFHKSNSAAEAAKAYDGVKVDGRPMKIEVILGAQFAPAPPPVKGLGDRISKPKTAAAAKPKSAAAAPKPVANGESTRGRGRGRGGRGGGTRRPKKTAEELDADMQDYFDPNAAVAAPATNGAAATAAPAVATNGGEAAMEDEIM